jgi:hypothetical protein
MSWQDRVAENIRLISPLGNIFIASWRGNTRSVAKKLGIFENPEVKGAIVQDLEIGATRHPISFFFSGANNDLESQRFFKSAGEKGLWNIIHPVIGRFTAQLISISETIDPTASGNIAQIDTEWIDVKDPSGAKTLTQIAQEILQKITQTNLSSSLQLSNETSQETPGLKFTIKDTAQKLSVVVENNLKELYEQSTEVGSRFKAIQRSLNTTISQDVINLEILASQVQNLIQTPILATIDISSRVKAYKAVIDDIFLISSDGMTLEDYNKGKTQEVYAVAALMAIPAIMTSGQLTTREEAVGFIDSTIGIFNDTVRDLDGIQVDFVNLPVEKQYFSQSQSFYDSLSAVGSAINYLLRISFEVLIYI